MANAGVVDLDADFVGTGRLDLDVFDCQVLSGFPSNRCLVRIRNVLVEHDAGPTLQVIVCQNSQWCFQAPEARTLPTVSDGMAGLVVEEVECVPTGRWSRLSGIPRTHHLRAVL